MGVEGTAWAALRTALGLGSRVRGNDGKGGAGATEVGNAG